MAKKKKHITHKSNHKHIYNKCLYYTINKNNQTTYHPGTYCTICNRVGNIDFLPSEKCPDGYYKLKTQEEILLENKDLPIFFYK